MNSASRSTLRIRRPLLEPEDFPVNARILTIEGRFDARRVTETIGNHADVGATKAHLAGHTAQKVAGKLRSIEGRIHILCEGNSDPRYSVSPEVTKVKDAYISVKTNVGALTRSERLARISSKISEIMESRGMKQRDLADLCGVSRVQVSRWIHRMDIPSTAALLRVSDLAPAEERQWWRDQAAIQAGLAPGHKSNQGGDTSGLLPMERSTRTIAFITNLDDVGDLGPMAASAACAPAQDCLNLPEHWFSSGGEFRAIRLQGEPISSVVQGECIAVVDISHRDAKSLVNCVVAARTVEGIRPRWVREDRGVHFLLPLQAGTPRVVQYEGEDSIIGRIVKWIGDAPSPRLPSNPELAQKLKRKRS